MRFPRGCDNTSVLQPPLLPELSVPWHRIAVTTTDGEYDMTDSNATGDGRPTGPDPTGVGHAWFHVDGAVDDSAVRRLVEQVADGLRQRKLPHAGQSLEVTVVEPGPATDGARSIRLDIRRGDEAVDAVSDHLAHWGEWLREQGHPSITGISTFEDGIMTWYLRPESPA